MSAEDATAAGQEAPAAATPAGNAAAEDAAAEDAAAYTWTQNFEEVVITVPVSDAVTPADVKFKVMNRGDVRYSLELAIQGTEICSGELAKFVDPEECSWTLEKQGGRRVLVVTLQKVNRTAYKKAREWPCLWAKDVES
eukprot:TRINITY_DN123314_c0_g1_i1.p1 TRINITY_DN123314_c0_g1~~TRINITY_DN123314_c0_g1_i1.p1  ORF type:complete len:160 (+),score=50.57 TRINITY_DN123314_c0_g1_i1:64-480(+)